MLTPGGCRLQSSPARHRKVVHQGLRPEMAMLACNNLTITSSALSREIGKVVLRHAEAEVARRCRERTADVTGCGAVDAGDGEGGGGGEQGGAEAEVVRKRKAEDVEDLVASEADDDGEEGEGSQRRPRGVRPNPRTGADASVALAKIRYPAPYLKGGPTHFQRKVAAKVERIWAERTRQTSIQEGDGRRDEEAPEGDLRARFVAATKEATRLFADLRAGKVEDPKTQPEYIHEINRRYRLGTADREDRREKQILTVRTIQRLVAVGQIGTAPIKKGRKPASSRVSRVCPTPVDNQRDGRHSSHTSVPGARGGARAGHAVDEAGDADVTQAPHREAPAATGPRPLGSPDADMGPNGGHGRPREDGDRGPPREGGDAVVHPPVCQGAAGPERGWEHVPHREEPSPELEEDVQARFVAATKEATRLFADLRAGRIPAPKSQPRYIDELNRKYRLDGRGREGAREKRMLTVRTVQRLVKMGQIGTAPVKKGRKPGGRGGAPVVIAGARDDALPGEDDDEAGGVDDSVAQTSTREAPVGIGGNRDEAGGVYDSVAQTSIPEAPDGTYL